MRNKVVFSCCRMQLYAAEWLELLPLHPVTVFFFSFYGHGEKVYCAFFMFRTGNIDDLTPKVQAEIVALMEREWADSRLIANRGHADMC